MYNEIEGNLISLSLLGNFDVIAHGCNCFNVMGAGIALQMRNVFNCNILDDLEHTVIQEDEEASNIELLGTISWFRPHESFSINCPKDLVAINAYTQYQPGPNLDYEALTLCMRKINHIFKGKHIGLPQIGAGIAGGDWNRIKTIIQQELKDCDVTVVIYNK